MKALTWQGKEHVQISEVAEPRIQDSRDAIVRVTSTAICGSDLHLYGVLGPYLKPGDVLGHEFMGIVEEVGSQVHNLHPGDRVVVPFNISCGRCYMCDRGLQSQCETTQVEDYDKGAALFGYTSLYGAVPGGQAELVRVPQAQYGPLVLPAEGDDERYLYLSDILPTAWQAVQYAGLERGQSIVVMGLGPLGQLVTRVARYLGASLVIGVDLVEERLTVAQAHGVQALDLRTVDDVGDAVRELTDGRGADCAVDAVGMEAHGGSLNTAAKVAAQVATSLPGPLSRLAMERVGVDRLAALVAAFDAVRRGGTVSISGVYGGSADPMNLMRLFDKQVTLRMGQANVRRWTDELLPILTRAQDVFGVDDLATHRLPLEAAPDAYRMFQRKEDGCLKVVLKPGQST